MSKRLQVLLPDADYKALIRGVRALKMSVSDWVRDQIREGLQKGKSESAEERLSKILKYAKYSGPTGNIENMLNEIERGRNS
ncbi:MAG: hypothetical protein JWQ35_1637 [Bacteriovoracaceae bacterium]|nr:hypothetical protein [Bacteriovoracaceae bacterium]